MMEGSSRRSSKHKSDPRLSDPTGSSTRSNCKRQTSSSHGDRNEETPRDRPSSATSEDLPRVHPDLPNCQLTPPKLSDSRHTSNCQSSVSHGSEVNPDIWEERPCQKRRAESTGPFHDNWRTNQPSRWEQELLDENYKMKNIINAGRQETDHLNNVIRMGTEENIRHREMLAILGREKGVLKERNQILEREKASMKILMGVMEINMKPLKMEKQKAEEQMKVLEEQLKAAETRLEAKETCYREEMQMLKEEANQAKERVNFLELEKSHSSDQKGDGDGHFHDGDKSSLQKELAKKMAAILLLQSKNMTLQKEKEDLNQQIQDGKEHTEEMKKLKEEVDDLQQSLTQAADRIVDLEQANREQVEQLNNLEKQLNIKEKQMLQEFKRASELKKSYEEEKAEKEEMQRLLVGRHRAAEENGKEQKDKISNLENELKTVKENISMNRAKLIVHLEKVQEVRFAELEKRETKLLEKIDAMEKDLEAERMKQELAIQNITQELEKVTRERDQLAEIDEKAKETIGSWEKELDEERKERRETGVDKEIEKLERELREERKKCSRELVERKKYAQENEKLKKELEEKQEILEDMKRNIDRFFMPLQ